MVLAAEVVARAGDGEAAFAGVLEPAAAHRFVDDRVQDVPHVPYTVVVAVPDEQPQVHVRLVGRETGALGNVHGEEHVVDHLRQLSLGEKVRRLPAPYQARE